MSDVFDTLLRQVDEIRLLRVESWEDGNREHIAKVIEQCAAELRVPARIDWPARFRAAAEVVHQAGDRWPVTAQHFDDLADRLESGLLRPDVVEAIGRALLGETNG